MRSRSFLLLATAVAAVAAPALAHRQWLLPSTTTLANLGQYVTFDAAVSNDLFYPDHFPMPLANVKAWAPDGTPATIENASTGRYRSVFDVKIDKPGTWKIGTENVSVMGSFKVNGEEWRIGGRRGGGRPGGPGAPGAPPAAPRPAAEAAPQGGAADAAAPQGVPAGPGRMSARSVASVADIPANATDVKLTEVISRNFVFVTAGAPTDTVLRPSGKGLELQPITHPGSLVADEPAQFRFLVDGKPAAGIKVEVVPGAKKFRGAEGAQALTTGADGIVKVTWPVAGVYWLSAQTSDNKGSAPRVTGRRLTYITTLEVPAP